MKKGLSWIVIFVLLLNLSACGAPGEVKAVAKEGVGPYELSAEEENILRSFGMADNSQIISFQAPKEAISMHVNVYRLNDKKEWENSGGSGISIGEEREPVDVLSGTLAMHFREDYSMDFHINCAGQSSFVTEPVDLGSEPMAGAKGVLEAFQSVELNKEIPVAVTVYDSGNTMKSYSPQDYFEPSKFDGMDLVQVVTLEFSEKELSDREF